MSVTSDNTQWLGGDGKISLGYDTNATVGMYGVTPTAQAATIAAVATTGATAGIAGLQTAVNSILTALKNIGIVAV
jgi:hypothetical protein